MPKNPYLNAVLAGLYIFGLVSLVFGIMPKGPDPDTILLPMAMLALFTLSAAVMGYLFLGIPLQMYLDGDKKEAVGFFLKTVGAFALIAAMYLGALVFFYF